MVCSRRRDQSSGFLVRRRALRELRAARNRLVKEWADGMVPVMPRSGAVLCWLPRIPVSQSVLLRASLVSTSASFTDGVRDWIS